MKVMRNLVEFGNILTDKDIEFMNKLHECVEAIIGDRFFRELSELLRLEP